MADANYTKIKASRIITRVRRILDQVPFTTEDTATASHVVGSPTTRFSDAELLDVINRAERHIVSTCKACHVYGAIAARAMGSDGIVFAPTQVVYRILGSRVFNDEATPVRARRRAVGAMRRLKYSGLNGSTARPIFAYEDGEFSFQPSDTYTVNTVTAPTALTAVTDDLTIDGRFEAALVYYVAAQCYQKLRRSDLYQFADAIFKDEITPYLLNMRSTIIDDREVEVE